jgi:MerR family regulatory protein
MTDGLTIGRAAAFPGVTIKTVRHYHRLGLADEPECNVERPRAGSLLSSGSAMGGEPGAKGNSTPVH